MATFAWGIGALTLRYSFNSQKVYRGLMSTCALAAMGVGCFWLITSF